MICDSSSTGITTSAARINSPLCKAAIKPTCKATTASAMAVLRLTGRRRAGRSEMAFMNSGSGAAVSPMHLLSTSGQEDTQNPKFTILDKHKTDDKCDETGCETCHQHTIHIDSPQSPYQRIRPRSKPPWAVRLAQTSASSGQRHPALPWHRRLRQ